jgi:hypothetical protein
MTSPDHAGQHANANDALVAIETAIGTTGTPVLARLASPALSGTPTAPTNATATDATTQVATDAFVQNALAGVFNEFKGRFVYDIINYGTVDPTGVVDSTAAILAALAAAAANPQGGIVWLGPGILKTSSALVINSNTVSLVGAGISATILEPTSALNGGIALTVQMNPFQSGVNYLSAGTFKGFTIDGSNTTNATGIQYGDIVGGRLDVSVNNFRGTGYGIHFINLTNWTEENFIRVFLNLNTVGCFFEATGGGTNSFGYNDIDIYMRPGGGLYTSQVGIQISTSIQIYNSKFRVTGNIDGNNSIGIKGVTSGTTYGGLPFNQFDINMEINGTYTGLVPIQLPAYFQFYGSGFVDTTGGVIVNSTNSGNTSFSGWWNVAGFTPGGGVFTNGGVSPHQVVAANILAATAGTDTSGTATASSPSFTTGTALQVNTTQDVILYVEVTTAAALAIAIGSTSSPATAIVSSVVAALGLLSIRVPKGWYVKITGTIADLNITAVSC